MGWLARLLGWWVWGHGLRVLLPLAKEGAAGVVLGQGLVPWGALVVGADAGVVVGADVGVVAGADVGVVAGADVGVIGQREVFQQVLTPRPPAHKNKHGFILH